MEAQREPRGARTLSDEVKVNDDIMNMVIAISIAKVKSTKRESPDGWG